ncbi:MAG TPA: glycerophosphodiester phosphodiesterase [Candidatus Sulfotelmatobacter sp.]|nr:glycerophosphodiester phosphodiesterase [Candidatus Sulfotelmatobacter sp.]
MTGTPGDRPLLLGHRGARARKSIPENSVASFDQALADGCDGFEFDVRRTADGKAVICHDPHSEGVEIASSPARQCRGLLRLEDVLTRYQERAFLDIELKVSGLETVTLTALRDHPPRAGFVISSFLPQVVRALHAEAPEVPIGLICETRAQVSQWRHLPIEYVIPHHKLAGATLIREVKQAGRKIVVWSVNSKAQMERFREWGVDGIISDDTALLSRTLK